MTSSALYVATYVSPHFFVSLVFFLPDTFLDTSDWETSLLYWVVSRYRSRR
jgi:hypothetical protein